MRDAAEKILTLVVPVYNESSLIGRSFDAIAVFLSGFEPGTAEVIFVNDGSPDNSGELLARCLDGRDPQTFRLINYERNRGKGYAVRQGVAAAIGRYVLMSDADLSTPLGEWEKLRAAVEAGAEFACGSRAVAGARVGKPPPLHRRMLSKLFNMLVRLAGVQGIRDTQCGFKLFRREAGQRVFAAMRVDRFAFDVEMISLARQMGYRVVEVPVNWDYSGHSTVRVFSSGSRMLWDLCGIALRRLLGTPRS
ncbi:MAG: glycosyltransferase family 2 protein [Kiritimatiellae bacterium]|nr:glycosyltransferase family 2 protein [Kiritimatiellia bacterium]